MRETALLLVLVAACSIPGIPPTEEEISSADYGTPIAQDEAEALAEEFMRGLIEKVILFDPDGFTPVENTKRAHSMKAEWEKLRKGWATDFFGGKKYFGYELVGMVDFRDKFGQYPGAKPYSFIFHDGKIIIVVGKRESGGPFYVDLNYRPSYKTKPSAR